MAHFLRRKNQRRLRNISLDLEIPDFCHFGLRNGDKTHWLKRRVDIRKVTNSMPVLRITSLYLWKRLATLVFNKMFYPEMENKHGWSFHRGIYQRKKS